MSYTPTTWSTGDTITASALNKIEQGIADGGSGALIVQYNYNTQRLDKTVQEIYDAMESGIPVYLTYKYGTLPTDYVSNKWLAPIVMVYSYNYANNIRIVAIWANHMVSQPSGAAYVHASTTVNFSASSMSEYPIFYRRVSVDESALTTNTYFP